MQKEQVSQCVSKSTMYLATNAFFTQIVAFWSLEVQKAAAKGTPQSHILITSHLVMGLLMTLDLLLGLFMTLGTRGPFTFWWFQTRTA